jgi:ABC-2 type transport system permease protein
MNWLRVGRLIQADLSEYLKRPIVWVWWLILFLFSWGFSRGSVTIGAGDSTVGGAKAWITSQFALAQVMGTTTLLFHGFFVAILCGMPILRDDDVRIGAILHTTLLRKREYVAGKYLASLTICGMMLLGNIVLLALFNHIVPNGIPEIRGPFAVGNYLVPMVMFSIPTVMLISGVGFALGTWSKRPVTVFVLPVGLLLLCSTLFWGWTPLHMSSTTNALLMALDPSGFRWLQQSYLEVDRGVAFYNHQAIHWDLWFVLSRVGWIVLGVTAVAFSVRFVGREKDSNLKNSLIKKPVGQTPLVAETQVSFGEQRQYVVGKNTVIRACWQLWSLARLELNALFRQAGFYLFVPVILLTTVPGAVQENGPFFSSLLPMPGFLAQRCMGTLVTCIVLLLLFYTVESLERDQRARLDPILHSTQQSPAIMLGGRLIANLVMALVIMFVAWLACMAVMLIKHVPSKSLMPFVLLWGICGIPTLLVWTSFVGMVWSLTRNRFTTYGISLAVLTATGWLFLKGKATWLVNWALWKSVLWSDISTLEVDRSVLILNRLFAVALALLFFRLAVRFYPQKDSDRLANPWFGKRRLLVSMVRMTPFWIPALGLGIALWVVVTQGFQGEASAKNAKKYWKQNIATFEDIPLPDLQKVDLDVDLEPATHRMNVKGSYLLKNATKLPIRVIPITLGSHMSSATFSLNGKPYVPENRSGLVVFRPTAPLAEGQTITIGFRYASRFPDGASKNGGRRKEFILPSSVMLTSLDPTLVPVIGFRNNIGVDDDNRMEERVFEKDFYQGQTPSAIPGAGSAFQTRIQITTPADLTANSVGSKTLDQISHGKRTVVWESDQPVYLFNIIVGKWAVHKQDGTEVYYDPRHAINVPEISLALRSAKKLYSEWFYPYPWKTLKLSEFAGLDFYAQGFPTNISFSENIGFLADPNSDDHLAFWITAHEAAHQWWPNLVIPGKGPGSPVLSEGISHFSAMLLLEAVKGEKARMDFAKRLEHNYSKQRVADAEQPLFQVDEDGKRKGLQTVWYDRGGWAFWMLMNRMGRQAMFDGLRAFITDYRGNSDHPTLDDFFVVLRKHASDPKAFDDCQAQWFESTSVPHYQILSATKTKVGKRWRVAGSLRNVGTGSFQVDVAIEKGVRFQEDKASERNFLQAKTQVVVEPGKDVPFSLEADFEPQRVVVDPDVMVLQLGRKGTVKKL